MITRLIEALQALDPQPTAAELADALWLAEWLRTHEGAPHLPAEDGGGSAESPVPEAISPTQPAPAATEPPARTVPAQATEAALYLARQDRPALSFPIRAPSMPAVADKLRLARALRPLRATMPSLTRAYLDEAETAQRIAETGVCEPIMVPSPERRHDLALVVDVGASMVVWRRTVEELRALLEQLGAFRDVRVWYLDSDGESLRLRTGVALGGGPGRNPQELVDPTHRRVVLVVSDCIGLAWQDGRAAGLLDRWGRAGPVAIAQPLPQRLWRRVPAAVEPVRISAYGPALANERLTVVRTQIGPPDSRPRGIAIPVVELTERWLRPWAAMIAHGGLNVTGAALFTGRPVVDSMPMNLDSGIASPEERIKWFRASSSPTAFRLATFFAAAPLRLPVMRLVQQAMLPASTPAHLAEVFLGGLLRTAARTDESGEEEIEYEFHDGVREILLSGLQRREVLQVLRAVWDVVRDRIGSSLDFPALLKAVQRGEPELPPDQPFARVAAQALARLGGRYREIAEQIITSAIPAGTEPVLRRRVGAVAAVPDERVPALRGGLPSRNLDFTGRDRQLAAVHTELGKGMAALLPQPASGMGGEGKSQLAVEYAYRYADHYDLIWWVPAEQTTSARAALALLARQLGTPLSDDIKDTVDGVLQALRDGRPYGRWLLIYDNAQDPDQVVPFTPLSVDGTRSPLTPGRHVLVTSRDRTWEQHAFVVDVDVFERSESIALLRRLVPRLSDAEADLLSERVGDLPLAVQQAAAWQVVTGGTVEDYLRLFDQRLAELPESYRTSDLPGPLAVSVSLTLDRLGEEDPVAGLLLELWAVFGPEPVPSRLLAAGHSAALPAELTELLADEDRLRGVMTDIARFSLARFDEDTGGLQVHRLVRAILSARLAEEERLNVQGYVHAILAAATPEENPEVESTWDRRAEITPHVVPSGVFDADGPEIQHVGIDQAQFLYQSGEFEGSRELADIALSRWLDRYGPDDEAVLDISRTLANALRGLGDNRAAAELSEDNLARMRRRFGDDDIKTLFAATGYGADLRFLGEFREAHQLDLDAWRRMRQLHGDNDADTLLAAANLGVDLRILGEFQAAYDIDRDIQRRQEGPDHSYRQKFRTTHHLARDRHALGQYFKAFRLQAKSLDDLDPVLIPNHAMVLQAKMSHAGTLRKLGRFEAAKTLATETLAAHVRRFGPEHANTLASKVCLALASCAVGDGEQALRFIDEALRGYRRVMNDDHPFVHVCMVGRALILRRLADVYAAQEADQIALSELRAGILGPNHFYALCAAVGLASDYYLLGELESAEVLLADVCEQFQRGLGERHHYALVSAHNLEQIRTAMGRPGGDAEQFVTALEQLLGPDHPEVTAAARGELLECDIEPHPL